METQRAQPAPRTPGRLFVGRQQEMAELSALLDDAVAGRGGLALLVGEPGIGKTRTAEEFAGLARDRGVTVRWGSAFEGQGTPAYWPWVEILREEASGSGAAGAEPGEEGPSADSLAQLLQEAGERVEAPSSLSALPPERARFRLFDGVSSLLRAASRRAPLLIVIDDLHWADEPSLLLLEFVVREIQSSPVLVVGTYRAEELGRQHPLSPVLGRLTMARRLALRGFSGDEVAELIEASAGSIPSAALVETVHQMTEGNPFFVAEVVRLLAANRLEPGGDGTWSVAVPQGVREVIGRRLGGLSEDCNAILRVASVIGRDFGAKLLARVAEVEPDELLSLLEEAGAGGLVEEVPGAIGHHRFSHALVRETLYAELTTIQRVRYHRRVAETLEELYGPASPVHLNELAHHYLEAAPSGDLHAAVAYARMAAERAVELLAYEEAVRLYESALQALELLGGGDDMRSQMLLGLGDAMWRSGDEAGASTAFREAVEAARRAGDPELLGRAALGPGSVVVMLGLEVGIPNEPQIALLEEALAALDGMESDLRSRILARLAAHLYWSAGTQSRRSELAAEAVELARRLDDPDALAYALSARHWATWTPDNLEERMTTADEVIRLASRRGNRLLEGLGRVYRVMDLLEAGRMVEAGREAALVGRIGDELRDPTTQWFAALCLGMDAILEGRFTDGERLAEDALRLGRGAMTGDSTWATMGYAMQVFCIGLHRGVIDQVEGAVRGMVHAIPNLPALQCTLAQASALMGREAQARTDRPGPGRGAVRHAAAIRRPARRDRAGRRRPRPRLALPGGPGHHAGTVGGRRGPLRPRRGGGPADGQPAVRGPRAAVPRPDAPAAGGPGGPDARRGARARGPRHRTGSRDAQDGGRRRGAPRGGSRFGGGRSGPVTGPVGDVPPGGRVLDRRPGRHGRPAQGREGPPVHRPPPDPAGRGGARHGPGHGGVGCRRGRADDGLGRPGRPHRREAGRRGRGAGREGPRSLPRQAGGPSQRAGRGRGE